MRRIPALAAFATVLALTITSPVLASTIIGGGSPNGAQEVPPVATAASGILNLSLDTDTGLVHVTGSVSGLHLADITFPGGSGLEFGAGGPFHIHNAPAGENGDIFVFINQASYFTDTFLGMEIYAFDVPFPLEFVGELLAGNTYFNLHTFPDHGGGEIRGQISAIPEPGTGLLLAMGLTFLGMRGSRARSCA